MPNRGSWNGKWSGENDLYAIVIPFSNSKTGKLSAQKILAQSSYYYNFGDGWEASIKCREVDNAEARRIKKQTKGFCGYNWMIDSIRKHGYIKA